jgi:hypothetical protein
VPAGADEGTGVKVPVLSTVTAVKVRPDILPLKSRLCSVESGATPAVPNEVPVVLVVLLVKVIKSARAGETVVSRNPSMLRKNARQKTIFFILLLLMIF